MSAVAWILMASAQAAAAAPQAGNSGPTIRPPHAGDCSLTIEMPAQTGATVITLALDSPDAPLSFKLTQRDPLVVAIIDPLQEGSEVFVTVDAAVAHARVAAGLGGGVPPASCGATAPIPEPTQDDRSVFEASGYLGRAFDNFAPNVVGDYRNIEGTGGTKSRWTAGVEAQYRLLGNRDKNQNGKKNRNTVYQLWLATQTLHGVRTADVDCSKTPSVAVCDTKDPTGKFLFILEHASTMEAHFDVRFEFARLQANSEMPIKAYAIARFGFLDLEGAPKVFNSDGIGAGILSPKGIFKGSSAQVAWGHSEQFQSNPGWNRLKINGVLVFDVATDPVSAAEGIVKRVGWASRVFVAITVDRNPGGPGPDSVQSYVGVDFDLRRVFGGFGG